MDRKRLAKKLEDYGLRKFFQHHGHAMCHHTVIPVQMASFLKISMNETPKLMAEGGAFERNLTLYNIIAAQSTPKEFLKALDETSNLQVLRIVKKKLRDFNAHDDEPIVQLIREELDLLCDKTVNRFQFAAVLSSNEVITEEEVHRDPDVNQKEDLKFLYEAVIDQRAWDELFYALKTSNNHLVIKHLLEKGFLLNEIEANPLLLPLPRKRRRGTNEVEGGESSGCRGFYVAKSSGLIQSDWKSSFTYTSITSEKKAVSGVTDFIPSTDTTSVQISRLNLEPSDLTRILRNCKDHLENLTLDDVSFVNFDSLPNSKPVPIQTLPLPKLKFYSIKFAQNRSHILTHHNYFKQALFFTPSSEQLCHLWHAENTIETIDFIFKGQRIFKMSPKEGELILCEYKFLNPVQFFELMNQLQSASNENVHNLKSFSGSGFKQLEVCHIPISVQRLHLRDCHKIESTFDFSRFSHLKKLIISMSNVISAWELNFKDLAQGLTCLESIAAERVAVKNTELIKIDDYDDNSNKENKNKFPLLTYLLFHECLGLDLSRDREIREMAEREESIIMDKSLNGWRVLGGSSYQDNFQEYLKKAFQNTDFKIT